MSVTLYQPSLNRPVWGAVGLGGTGAGLGLGPVTVLGGLS